MSIYQSFIWPVRVYWEDTDAGGVVYHASYLRFLERARSEWLRVQGHGQQALRERGDALFAVRAMKLDFLKPAHLDDQLAVGVQLQSVGGASLRFRQDVQRDGELLLHAEVRVACLRAADFRPRPLPEGMFLEQ